MPATDLTYANYGTCLLRAANRPIEVYVARIGNGHTGVFVVLDDRPTQMAVEVRGCGAGAVFEALAVARSMAGPEATLCDRFRAPEPVGQMPAPIVGARHAVPSEQRRAP
jgi:hypothetical protein